MMPKWTPGPWAVDPDLRAGMNYNRHIVLERNPDKRIAFMAHNGPRSDEFKANADLIAAAPELYEALVGMVSMKLHPRECDCPACSRARAALAKARGET